MNTLASVSGCIVQLDKHDGGSNMKLGVLGGVSLALSLIASTGYSAEDQEIKRYTSQVCAACHGPKGNSISPAFPRLAGQQAAYIEAQLTGFHDRTRGDPAAQAYMWGMASQLDARDIKQLAAYYAAQRPVPGAPGDKTLMAQGKTIYEQGMPDAGVPACATCHGAAAEGKEAIPRLAGQHPAYLVKQLAYFKAQLRANAPVMHAVTDKMTFDQMEAVATYAASK